jgi:glycosyltransferase involved in cell wall biosynthesis
MDGSRHPRIATIHPVSSDAVARPALASPLPPLSIVIPVFNGSATITSLVEELAAANPGHDLQVVLVNDGSADGSGPACSRLARRFPGTVTFVDLARNAGEHNAVMAGLAHARGSFCVIMDDDFQNPPEEAFRLAEAAIRGRRDIVFSMYPQKMHHWARNLGSWAANTLARRLMGLPTGLYLSSFKCLSRFTVDHVLAYRGPFAYIDGLALRTTRNIGVVTARHHARLTGRSGYTPAKLFRLWSAMTVNFSLLPLRIASFLGFLFGVLGLAGAVAVVVEKLQHPALPVGWPSLIVTVFILAGGILIILGVMGEYHGQLMLTVNGTPQYVVRSVEEEAGAGEQVARERVDGS